MSDEQPTFPAEETVHIAALSLQSAMSGTVSTALAMGAAMTPDGAVLAATNAWREGYPEYLAASVATMNIRRAKMTNRFIFWEGFGAGLFVIPAICFAVLGVGLLIAMVRQ